MVLTFNGTANDYFIGGFFFYSGLIGMIFFRSAGLFIVEKSYYKKMDGEAKEIDPDSLDNPNLEDYFQRVMTIIEKDIVKEINDNNVQTIQLLSLFLFMLNVFFMYKIDVIFDFLAAGYQGLDMNVTTLGITSTIMILYNMIAWPYIQEKSSMRSDIRLIKSEKERADELIRQLDVIVDFCSSIMSTVKSLKTGGVGEIIQPPPCYNNGLARFYDSTDHLITEFRLRQLDQDGK